MPVYRKNEAWRRNPKKFARALLSLRKEAEEERAVAKDGRYVVELVTTPATVNWAVIDSRDDTLVSLYSHSPGGKASALMCAHYKNQEGA